MSRNILVPDAPATESDTTEDESVAQNEQPAVNDENVVADTSTTDNDTPQIPEKYQGKSLDEIIEMHMNAEKEIGRQANEVGTYRDLLKSMSEATSAKPSPTDTTESKPQVEVSSDDLWENPTEAIRNVVRDALTEELAPIQQQSQQQRLEAEVSGLMQEHPDAEAIGADPEFIKFVENSPYRLQDAQRWVEQRDVNAARRLLSDWKELHPKQAAEPTKVVETNEGAVRKARAVATESGRGSGGPKGQDTLSKRDVMKTFINDRDLYDSPSFQQKLLAHARRGTLVD